jgi:hypothetical protein
LSSGTFQQIHKKLWNFHGFPFGNGLHPWCIFHIFSASFHGAMGLGVGVELQVVGILIRGGVARLGAEKSNKPANS